MSTTDNWQLREPYFYGHSMHQCVFTWCDYNVPQDNSAHQLARWSAMQVWFRLTKGQNPFKLQWLQISRHRIVIRCRKCIDCDVNWIWNQLWKQVLSITNENTQTHQHMRKLRAYPKQTMKIAHSIYPHNLSQNIRSDTSVQPWIISNHCMMWWKTEMEYWPCQRWC